MSKRKDVIVKVPTAKIELKGLPPTIEIIKESLQKNWKYIIMTWIIIFVVAFATSFLGNYIKWYCVAIIGILLSIIPFILGSRAIKKHTTKEISR